RSDELVDDPLVGDRPGDDGAGPRQQDHEPRGEGGALQDAQEVLEGKPAVDDAAHQEGVEGTNGGRLGDGEDLAEDTAQDNHRQQEGGDSLLQSLQPLGPAGGAVGGESPTPGDDVDHDHL